MDFSEEAETKLLGWPTKTCLLLNHVCSKFLLKEHNQLYKITLNITAQIATQRKKNHSNNIQAA